MTERKVWFERCGCSARGRAHGYFHDAVMGKSPYPNMSVETAEGALERITEARQLTPEEVEAVRAQINGAGLQEETDEMEQQVFSTVDLMIELAELSGLAELHEFLLGLE